MVTTSLSRRVCRHIGPLLVCASLASAQGIIVTIAGNGTPGFAGDGGPATSGQLNFTTSDASGTEGNSTSNPKGVAVDAAGNVYFADYGNERIRKFAPGGSITTIAGNGIAGFSGDGGRATSAEICTPEGIWLDTAGNLYIADALNYRVRKVTPGGIITTVAGNGTAGFSGDGGPATSAELYWPAAVAVDGAGNLYIADYANSLIRKVTPGGIITTVAGGGFGGFGSVGDGVPATDAALSYP
jgi:streptogramin lyase